MAIIGGLKIIIQNFKGGVIIMCFHHFCPGGIVNEDLVYQLDKFLGHFISEQSKTFTIPKTMPDGDSATTITSISSDFIKDILNSSYSSIKELFGLYYKIYHKDIRRWFRKVETIIIPNSVIRISSNAFNNSEAYIEGRPTENLKNIIISDSVRYIEENAFKDIPHIEYHGSASGAPWGAKSMN